MRGFTRGRIPWSRIHLASVGASSGTVHRASRISSSWEMMVVVLRLRWRQCDNGAACLNIRRIVMHGLRIT